MIEEEEEEEEQEAADRKVKAVKMEESEEESEDSDETSDEEMDEEAIARRRELMRQRAQAKAQLGVIQVRAIIWEFLNFFSHYLLCVNYPVRIKVP